MQSIDAIQIRLACEPSLVLVTHPDICHCQTRQSAHAMHCILDSQTKLGGSLFGLHDGLLRDTILRQAAQHFPGGSLNFQRFETDNIDERVEFIRSLIEWSAKANGVSIEELQKGVKIMATSGVLREDEMECLIEGLKFVTLIPDEVYYFSDELIHTASHTSTSRSLMPGDRSDGLPTVSTTRKLKRPGLEPPKYAVTFEGEHMAQLSCLLVNIGSGVSIIKVDEDGKFERVSGTSLGSGTLWGLLSLLTPATSFDEMLAFSEKGTNTSVDMLVGDIYGQDYSRLGLKSTIAGSFGKVFKKGSRKGPFKPEDISRSLLYAISNNIGQIA